jgi:hypothetical protein
MYGAAFSAAAVHQRPTPPLNQSAVTPADCHYRTERTVCIVTSSYPILAKPGAIVRIAAGDYLNGTTAMTVRVAKIAAGLDKVRGLEWVHVVVTDAERPDAEPRALVVRATALRQPHTPPSGQPGQQACPPNEFISARASDGRLIPSPRRPLTTTVGAGEGTDQQPGPVRGTETGQ